MIRKEDALAYHASERPGKIEDRPTTACLTPREMRLAYLPGASYPAREIADDGAAAFRYTARGNLVAVVSNGTAVPGLGDVGPLAAKPMGEGMAVLLKRLADLDVFDLEVAARSAQELAETIVRLEPTFGAINLKDIRAPEGLELYDLLLERLHIPVLHENLHGTAVVAAAALINALDLVDKRIDAVRVVLCGAGTVGTGCARLLLQLGIPSDALWVYDAHGAVRTDRADLYPFQRALARDDAPPSLAEALRGADVFVGASAANVVTPEMVRAMARYPIVLALATPDPEIDYEAARASRHDVLVATALDQNPNAVVDLLSVPYVLRGALDVHATRITPGMLLAAARSLAELAREDVPEEVERAYGRGRFAFGPEYLLPKPIDPRVLERESLAVARQAEIDGVATRTLEPESYRDSLAVRLGPGRDILRGLILRARQAKFRVALSEGSNETILRASRLLLDEGIASPILVGNEAEIRDAIDRLRLDLGGVPVVDPARSPRFPDYVEAYWAMRRRRGVMRASAERRLRARSAFAAMMVASGDADMMVAGVGTHYAESLRSIFEVIGMAPGIRRIAGHYLVLLPKRVLVLADCAVNVDPAPVDLAEIALLAARAARAVGLEPKVAMLSFSNFGSVDHPSTLKVREATEIVRARASELVVDGEMQILTALDGAFRREYFPWSALDGDANVLVFPNLEAGNLALQMLQSLGAATVVGPSLMGTRLPAQLLQYGVTAEDVVNLVAIGIVQR